jgi:hypothetical protein
LHEAKEKVYERTNDKRKRIEEAMKTLIFDMGKYGSK